MSVQLKVSEVSAASPDMDDAQFDELVEDMRKHGQLVPIWKSGDEIIDGRKRARACSILGIPAKAINMTTDMDQTTLSRSLNILRTHYSASQRAMFAAKMATWKKEWGAKGKSIIGKFADDNKTTPEAAKEAGVSTRVVTEAKQIIRDGAPEVMKAVEAGTLSVHSAKQIVDSVPKADQAEAVKKKLAGPRLQDGRFYVRHKAPPRARRLPLGDRMDRCLDQLENAVELLAQFTREDGGDEHVDHPSWVKRLSKARTVLSRIINH